MYFIYRYVDQRDNQILYVGKTKRNLRDRIIEHENEIKFLPYLNIAKIQYYTVSSHVEMDIHEKYWIHVTQPKLNVVDRYAAEAAVALGVQLQEIRWRDYDPITIPHDVFTKAVPVMTYGESEYDRLDQEYINAETFLEYSFEQYISEIAECADARFGFHWDLTAYPLPAAIPVGSSQWISFYIQAVESPDTQDMILWNTYSNLKWLWSSGSTVISNLRRQLTIKRLA